MAIHFTCPHCGKRAVRADLSDSDVEYVDLGNGLPDAIFLAQPPGQERHIDERLACDDCWERADSRGRDDSGKKLGPHPWSPNAHAARHARPGQAKEL